MECAVIKHSRRAALGLLALITTGQFAAVRPAAATEGIPLAIRGYDPVAYFTLGKPVRGLAELEYEWDEQKYRFANSEHRQLFRANPLRYAPQFANFCTMALTRGDVDRANPEYWLINDGKLYLFGQSFGPSRFQQALSENLAKAARNRVLIQKR
jgi:YHS domain-containing protein